MRSIQFGAGRREWGDAAGGGGGRVGFYFAGPLIRRAFVSIFFLHRKQKKPFSPQCECREC